MPNWHFVVPDLNPVPPIVTRVPPACGPFVGRRLETRGPAPAAAHQTEQSQAGYAAFAARSCQAGAASSTNIDQGQPATDSPQNVVASTNKTSAESKTVAQQRAGRVAAPPSCSHEGILVEQLRRRTADDISAGAAPRAQEPALCYTNTLPTHRPARVWASWLGYPFLLDGLGHRNIKSIVAQIEPIIGEIMVVFTFVMFHSLPNRLCSTCPTAWGGGRAVGCDNMLKHL